MRSQVLGGDALVEQVLAGAQRVAALASGSAWKYAVYSGEKCSSPSLEYSIGRKPPLRVNQSTRAAPCSSRSAKISAALWPGADHRHRRARPAPGHGSAR